MRLNGLFIPVMENSTKNSSGAKIPSHNTNSFFHEPLIGNYILLCLGARHTDYKSMQYKDDGTGEEK